MGRMKPKRITSPHMQRVRERQRLLRDEEDRQEVEDIKKQGEDRVNGIRSTPEYAALTRDRALEILDGSAEILHGLAHVHRWRMARIWVDDHGGRDELKWCQAVERDLEDRMKAEADLLRSSSFYKSLTLEDVRLVVLKIDKTERGVFAFECAVQWAADHGVQELEADASMMDFVESFEGVIEVDDEGVDEFLAHGV